MSRTIDDRTITEWLSDPAITTEDLWAIKDALNAKAMTIVAPTQDEIDDAVGLYYDNRKEAAELLTDDLLLLCSDIEEERRIKAEE